MKRDRILKDRLRERVVVTLKTGETFAGLFDDYDERNLVLIAAEAVGSDGATKADGALVLPWANVSYVQKP